MEHNLLGLNKNHEALKCNFECYYKNDQIDQEDEELEDQFKSMSKSQLNDLVNFSNSDSSD